jgi:hypothetical protein
MWFFDLVSLETAEKQLLADANATFDRAYPTRIGPTTSVGVLSKMAVAGTTLGRVDATRHLVPNQMRGLTTERQTAYRGGAPLLNRLALREGPQAMDAQRLGRASDALELALLQSLPATPAGDPVIRLFAAWPEEWDARFTLRARGAFVVSAVRAAGRIESVEVKSEAGVTCRIHNPWGNAPVTLLRNGQRVGQIRGTVLTFETTAGDVMTLSP